MNYIEERTYYPDGCPLDDVNKYHFQVGVYYKGQGKWMVARQREGHEQLTHTGKWLQLPQKFLAMRWCRHDFDAACKLAESEVNDTTLYGLTYAEWADHDHSPKKAAPLIRQRAEERREGGPHVA